MASTLPVPSKFSNHNHLLTCKYKSSTPAPPLLRLFLLLVLSLLFALFLLHINHLVQLASTHSPSLSRTHYFPANFGLLLQFPSAGPRLSNLDQGLLSQYIASPLRQLHQLHYLLSYLLSPCSIFILANLIIFTLLFKTFYLSPSSASPDNYSSSTATLPSFSDLAASEKFDSSYGGRYTTSHELSEYAVPNHEDFFLSLPPHPHYIFSPDPVEEYHHVLSFGASVEDSPSYKSRNMRQSYIINRRNDESWPEPVKGVSLGPYNNVNGSNVVNGVMTLKEVKRQDKVVVLAESKVQAQKTINEAVPTAANNKMVMGAVEQQKAVAADQKGADFDQIGKLAEGKACRSYNLKGVQAASNNCTSTAGSISSQAVVINMEAVQHPAPAAPRRPPALAVLGRSQINNPTPAPGAGAATPAPQPAVCKVQAQLAAVQYPPAPSNGNMLMQRPPSSPKARKSSLQGNTAAGAAPCSTTSCNTYYSARSTNIAGGTSCNSKPSFSDNELNKQQACASKSQPIIKPKSASINPRPRTGNMVRSYSDQRLSGQQSLSSSDIAAAANHAGAAPSVISSSSSPINRPSTLIKAHSVRSSAGARASTTTALSNDPIVNLLSTSCTSSNLLTAGNRPLQRMQRSQSLRRTSTSGTYTPADQAAPSCSAMQGGAGPSSSHVVVTRSPSFSEALDALSDADANERFSNFIAHRFALMKKELVALT